MSHADNIDNEDPLDLKGLECNEIVKAVYQLAIRVWNSREDSYNPVTGQYSKNLYRLIEESVPSKHTAFLVRLLCLWTNDLFDMGREMGCNMEARVDSNYAPNRD